MAAVETIGVTLPYGEGKVTVEIPKENLQAVLQPQAVPPVPDLSLAIRSAIANPLGTKRLRELAAPEKKVAIVINDITRPTPTKAIVAELLQELSAAGVPGTNITIVIANGVHRPCTQEEIDLLVGVDVPSQIQVENHDAVARDRLVMLGTTPHGIPVELNRTFCQADLKIITGTIGPHQTAGFTGGRKSVMPGIASNRALMCHHSFPIRSDEPVMGWLQGNLFHQEAVAAARMAGVDFIVNVVQNEENKVIKVVAGDLEEAWSFGVESCRAMFEVPAPQGMDIAIVAPGGHPKDINLHQAQKGLAPAELIIKRGGTIILAAACPQGVGNQTLVPWFRECQTPLGVIERFRREGFSLGSGKAFMLARALTKAEVVVVTTSISPEDLATLGLSSTPDLASALAVALAKHGPQATVAVLAKGTDLIPR